LRIESACAPVTIFNLYNSPEHCTWNCTWGAYNRALLALVALVARNAEVAHPAE
jgi:hypothetical protein